MDTNEIRYNGTIEVSARLLLLLSTLNEPKDAEYITVCDLIITYGKYFGMLEYNLHGNNETASSELTARRQTVNNALQYLVRHNLIGIIRSPKGFLYLLNNNGQNICKHFTTEYGNEYVVLSKKVIQILSSLNYTQLMDIIQLPYNANKESL